MHLFKRLLCLVPLALVATGCDVSTNQTGGDWLSTRYGVRTPAPVTLEGLPLSFKLAGRDSGWLQEASVSPLYQVGQWKGGAASTLSWISIDSTTLTIPLDGSWDSLATTLHLAALPTRTRSQRVVRVLQFQNNVLSSDSLALENLLGDRVPSFPAGELYRDTLTIEPTDTLLVASLPDAVRDSISLRRRKTGVLVRLLPVDDGHDGIVQVNGIRLRAVHRAGSLVNTYDTAALAGGRSRRGFLSTARLDPAVPLIQGGPSGWFLRLFPDTAKVRAAIASELAARGLATDLRQIAVLDARISFDEDTARIDTAGQRLMLYTAVNGAADVSVRMTARKDSIRVFDSVTVRLDTVTRSGDASALILRMATRGGLADSLVLTRADTLPVAHTFNLLRTVCRRHGDTVEVVGKGVAAGLVAQSQQNRQQVLNSGAYIGGRQTLSAQRAFSALLNWSDRQPEILLEPASTDSRQWWQVRPKLGTAKVTLTLLPLGAAP